jgi:hypothetical protein
MPPSTILGGTAVTLAALGIPLLFLPGESAALLGLAGTATVPLQLFAGGLLAMASLNWMGRGAIYGGIYRRPIVVSHFGFGLITAGTLMSALSDAAFPPWVWIPAIAAAVYSVAFWLMMRRPPWGPSAKDASNSPDGSSA